MGHKVAVYCLLVWLRIPGPQKSWLVLNFAPWYLCLQVVFLHFIWGTAPPRVPKCPPHISHEYGGYTHCFLFSLLVTNQTGFLKLPWGCTVSVTCVWIVKLWCVAGINMSCEGISWLAVWRSGNALASIDQRSCATSDPVSTRVGDRLRAAKPSPYVTSHPGWLSLLLYAGR